MSSREKSNSVCSGAVAGSGQRRQDQRRQRQTEADEKAAPPGIGDEYAVEDNEEEPARRGVADRLACRTSGACSPKDASRSWPVIEIPVLQPGEEDGQRAEDDQLDGPQGAQRQMLPPPQDQGHRRRHGRDAAVEDQGEAGKVRRQVGIDQVANQENERRRQREQGDQEQTPLQQRLDGAAEGRSAADRHGHPAARRPAARTRTARRIGDRAGLGMGRNR